MHYKYVSIEVSSEVMEQAIIQIRDVVKHDPEECEVNDTEIELAPKLASLCILFLHEFAEAQEQGKVVMDSIWLPRYERMLLVATASKLLMAPETASTREEEGE